MNVPNHSQKQPDSRGYRYLLAALACAGSLAVSTPSARAATTNVVDQFNAQIQTFATDYTYIAPPFPALQPFFGDDILFPEGRLAIVASSADVHGLWAITPTTPPPTTPGGFFLAVNGSKTAGQIVYQRSGIAVTAGGTYQFQADFASLFDQAPADLTLTVQFIAADGISVLGTVSTPTIIPTGVATWQTVFLPSGVAPTGSATVRITISNSETAASGNDFGIDNILFVETIAPPPPPPPPVTCVGTGTLGYWKNHPEAWPVNAITIGGVTYTKAQAIAKMGTPPAGDKTYTMFQQLVAARLNILIGNASTCIDSTITAADAWLVTYPLGSKPKTAAWTTGGPLATKLDSYNNGLLCATHRDDLNCN